MGLGQSQPDRTIREAFFCGTLAVAAVVAGLDRAVPGTAAAGEDDAVGLSNQMRLFWEEIAVHTDDFPFRCHCEEGAERLTWQSWGSG